MATIKNNKTAFVMLIVFFVLGIFYLQTLPPVIIGDVREYILQSVAFQRHLSSGVTEEDLEQAKEEFYYVAIELDEQYHNETYANWHEYKNAKYSNHFGAYSALVAPVKTVVTAVGVNPLRSFYITNFILYFAAALTVFFFLKVDRTKKLLILLLTLVNPAAFYLGWAQTEVYLYAFSVIGLVFYYNKQYALGIFFLAVASMQNLGVLPFVMMIGIQLIIERICEYRKESDRFRAADFLRRNIREFLICGLCYVPCFIPIVLTYIRFGTFSLVADVATENKYLMHKALAYAFDPNLGIFPYEPVVLLAFIVMLVIGLKKFRLSSIIHILGVGGIFYIISNQLQINSGMQNIMRYNVWILPAMFFFVVNNWDRVSGNINALKIMTASEAVYTALVMAFVLFGGGAYNAFEFAPWTEIIMDHCPGAYNPPHGIFYSRATGTESYHADEPVFYASDDGKIKKILLSREAESVFYGDDWILFDESGVEIDKESLKKTLIDEGDFAYINLPEGAYHAEEYSLGEVLCFDAENYNAEDYAVIGLSLNESWGTWTDGDEAMMSFYIDDSYKLLQGYIDVGFVFYQPQRVNIYANDLLVFSDTIYSDEDIAFAFNNSSFGVNHIKMELPDSTIPADVMQSDDRRDLGLGLLTMKITAPDYADLPADGRIHFCQTDYNAGDYVFFGISAPETNGTWTDSDEVHMAFSYPEGKAGQDVEISMELSHVFNKEQNVKVIVNGVEVYTDILTEKDSRISFSVPEQDDNNYLIELKLPDAVSPLSLGNADDPRILSLMIKEIVVE